MKRPFQLHGLSERRPIALNPVRAAVAETLEQSDHTSIQMRIDYWKRKATSSESPVTNEDSQPRSSMPFSGNLRRPIPSELPFAIIDYIELVDWTGRIIRDNKRGSISDEIIPIIQRLEISPVQWLELTSHFEDRFKGLVGSIQSLKSMCASFWLKRKANFSNSKLFFR